ncbi:MAG: 1-acyl-sn-glycerol-3-phosphate acyltransferase [Gammaproteobacteria bacterium]|nr:1-acyl-sn-glycerol-3-phosphate acyltransferase [Gammaproteobacteria bacterium]
MTLNQIKMAIYSLYLTNKFGFKLKKANDAVELVKLRLEYAEALLGRLNISADVKGAEKIEQGGQYLIISNHRSIIDPLLVEVALKNKGVTGLWVSKKELYNSLFFGMFTRNAGTILLDRESSQMSGFFKDVKENVKQGNTICIFPEGGRNKTDAPLAPFKEGSQLIAIKNRLPILPIFIKTNANEILMNAIKNNSKNLKIRVEVGGLIDCKDRSKTLEESYREQFNEPKGSYSIETAH